jgi:hypothetical protein
MLLLLDDKTFVDEKREGKSDLSKNSSWPTPFLS